MTIEDILEKREEAEGASANSKIVFQNANRPIVQKMKQRKEINEFVNQSIKDSPNKVYVEGNTEIVFNMTNGVKVLLVPPYTINTLPDELVKETHVIRSSDFKNACFRHQIHQYVTPKGMVAAEVERKIRVRRISDVPYEERKRYEAYLEQYHNCDIKREKIIFPGFPDAKHSDLVDLATASRAEIDNVKHMTTDMTRAFLQLREDTGTVEFIDDIMDPPYNQWNKRNLDKIFPYVKQGFNPAETELDPVDISAHLEEESDEAKESRITENERRKKIFKEAVEKGESLGDEQEYFENQEARQKNTDKIEENSGELDFTDLITSEIMKGIDLESLIEQDERLEKLRQQETGEEYSEARLASDLTEEELEELRKESSELLKQPLGEKFVNLIRKVFNRVLGRVDDLTPPREMKEDVEFTFPQDYEGHSEDLDETLRALKQLNQVTQNELNKTNQLDISDLPDEILTNPEELNALLLREANSRELAAKVMAGPREKAIIDEMLREYNRVAGETFNAPDKEAEREDARLRKEERAKRQEIRDLQKQIKDTDRKIEEIYQEKEVEATIELERIKLEREKADTEAAKKLLADDPNFGRYLKLDGVKAKIQQTRERMDRLQREFKKSQAFIQSTEYGKDPKLDKFHDDTIKFRDLEYPRIENKLRKYVALGDRLDVQKENKQLLDDDRRKKLEELADNLVADSFKNKKELDILRNKLKKEQDADEKSKLRKAIKAKETETSEIDHLADKYRRESFTGERRAKDVLDLNEATLSQLGSFGLNGRTIEHLMNNTPYEYLNDVLDVSGIGPTTIKQLLTSRSYFILQGWNPDDDKPKEFKTPKEIERDKLNNIKVPPRLKLTDKHRFLANQYLLSQICGRVDLNTAPLAIIQLLPEIGTDLGIKIIRHRPYLDLLDLLAKFDDERLNLKFLKKLAPLVLPLLNRKELIDLNSADLDELATLPHIGDLRAQLVTMLRPITHVDKLINIDGIGDRQIDDINPYVKQKMSKRPEEQVDLNSDNIAKLTSLPKISEKKAKLIVENRPYDFLEDLTDIPGITEKTIQDLYGKTRPGSIDTGNFGGLVDLNKASMDELIGIPFVASRTADIIVKERPIQFLSELKPSVPISQLLKIQPYVVQKMLDFEENDDLVDLNSADAELLEELPFVGAKTATRIIQARPIGFLDELIDIISFDNLKGLARYVVQEFKERENKLIDLNSDTASILSTLPGVDKYKVALIIKNRPYEYLDELVEIKGITEASVQKINPHVLQEYKDKDDELVDLNKATQTAIQTVPGLSASSASKIANYRKSKVIKNLDVLEALFDQALLRKIEPYVVQKFSDKPDEPDDLLDLNTASLDEIDELPNIGVVSAQKIIQSRPIKYLEPLLDIRGISYKTLESISPLVKQKFKNVRKDEEINLNTAHVKDILEIPGIGRVRAQAIYDNRPYKFLEELVGIKGIQIDFAKQIERYTVQKLKGNTDENRVDLNTATAREIMKVEGLGKRSSETIIDNRPFKSLNELLGIGFTKYTLFKIKDYVLPELTDGNKDRINLNKAELSTIIRLPGIGETNGTALINNRPYKILDELLEVEGFTNGTIKRFQHLVIPKLADDKLTDLNKASIEELAELPGITESGASMITKLRPITWLDELSSIFDDEIINKIKNKVVPGLKPKGEDDIVDLNSAPLFQIKSLPPLKSHQIVAEYLHRERPYVFLDDAINVRGMTHSILQKLSNYVLPKLKKHSGVNLSPEAKKAILEYVHKSSPKQLVEDLGISFETATKINVMKPYKTFNKFFEVGVVTKQIILGIVEFLKLESLDANSGENIEASIEDRKLILNYIHKSSPLDLQKAGLSKEVSVDINNGKPYPTWTDLVDKDFINQGIINLILDYLNSPPKDNERLELVIPFINSVQYEDWMKFPISHGALERIFSSRPYTSVKQLLNIKGVTIELLEEIYTMMLAPRLNKLIDLNKASIEELKAVRGISEKSAAKIIDNRPINSLNDLLDVLSRKFLLSIQGKVVQKFLPLVDLNKDTIEVMAKLPQLSRSLAQQIQLIRPIEYLNDLFEINSDEITGKFLNELVDFVIQEFKPKGDKTLVNLNSSAKTEIQNLPSITGSLAQLIINSRPIFFLDDLVGTIELKKLKKIEEFTEQKFQGNPEEDELEIIDLKLADSKTIAKIPGISKAVAEFIVNYVDKHRGFSLDDMFYVKEIGLSRTLKLVPYVVQKLPEKVDFSTITESELRELKPIKRAEAKSQKEIARLIIQYREENGPITSLDILDKVKYVNKSLLKLLDQYLNLDFDPDDVPPIPDLVDLNKGTAIILTEEISYLSRTDADFIVSQRPIKYLDQLVGEELTVKELERLDYDVVQKFSDGDNKPFEGIVYLNTDDAERIGELPGMTKFKAEHLVERRNSSPIQGLEDLLGPYNNKKSIFSTSLIEKFKPYVVPGYTEPNVSEAFMEFINDGLDSELSDSPLPNDVVDEILDVRPIETYSVMSIYGMTLELVAEVEEYLRDRDDDGIVDLNNDSKTQLLELKGMKPEIADLIITYRPFKYLDELADLPAIFRDNLEKWEEVVQPKFEYKYDINRATKARLLEIMTEKEVDTLVFGRPYMYLDDMKDKFKVIDDDLVKRLSMTEGVSLERDPDKLTGDEANELDEYYDSMR